MDAFMPNQSHLVALAFLGTGAALGLLGAAFVFFRVRGRRDWARRSLAAALALGLAYAAALAGASVASQEIVLAPGESKYFCEVDCHLAYSVAAVTTAKSLGPSAETVGARGTFYVVTVKTWFDPRTISRRRPLDVPLAPNARAVVVVDAAGRRYGPAAAAQAALEQTGVASTPLAQPLRPGESYTTTLVFDLPGDARNPRLLLTEATLVSRALVGHENSPLHKKVFFRM